MRLLVDMNLSPRWVQALNAAGHDAAHWSAIGDPRSPDQDVMRYAAEHDYTVLTHDLDFGTLLAYTSQRRPSVVQLRTDNINPDVLAPTVVAALQQYAEDLHNGALITVDPDRLRVRVLPL